MSLKTECVGFVNLVDYLDHIYDKINNGNWTEWSAIWSVIKTITKFSNVIGYQQPDLSINWTVAHVMLVIGQLHTSCL